MILLLCGTAFAGKSTIAARLGKDDGFTIISLDGIHQEMGNHQPISDSQWAAAHKEALRRTEDCLNEGRSVVIDDTLCYRFLRDSFRELADRLGVRSCLLVLQIEPDEVWRRLNHNRMFPNRHDVSDAVIEQHIRTFEWPGEGESPFVVDASQPIDIVYRIARNHVMGRNQPSRTP